jgi:hypothetical protein
LERSDGLHFQASIDMGPNDIGGIPKGSVIVGMNDEQWWKQ